VSCAWSRDEHKSKQQRESEPKKMSYGMLHYVTANPPRKDCRDNLRNGRNRQGSHHAQNNPKRMRVVVHFAQLFFNNSQSVYFLGLVRPLGSKLFIPSLRSISYTTGALVISSQKLLVMIPFHSDIVKRATPCRPTNKSVFWSMSLRFHSDWKFWHTGRSCTVANPLSR